MDDANRTDPMMKVFPRVTKCTFHHYGPSGTVNKKDALCILGLNIINEKIYVTLWFWLVILACLTAMYLIYVVAIVAVPGLRRSMVTRKARPHRQGLPSRHQRIHWRLVHDLPCLEEHGFNH